MTFDILKITEEMVVSPQCGGENWKLIFRSCQRSHIVKIQPSECGGEPVWPQPETFHWCSFFAPWDSLAPRNHVISPAYLNEARLDFFFLKTPWFWKQSSFIKLFLESVMPALASRPQVTNSLCPWVTPINRTTRICTCATLDLYTSEPMCLWWNKYPAPCGDWPQGEYEISAMKSKHMEKNCRRQQQPRARLCVVSHPAKLFANCLTLC